MPLAFIEEVYRLGGKDSFDVMNVHPYSRPRPPEDDLEREITELRTLMARYGDALVPRAYGRGAVLFRRRTIRRRRFANKRMMAFGTLAGLLQGALGTEIGDAAL